MRALTTLGTRGGARLRAAVAVFAVGLGVQGALVGLAASGKPRDARAAGAPARLAGQDGLVSVIVKLDAAPLAAYRGGIAGLRPTQARTAGTRRLEPRSAASRAYLAHLDGRLAAFEASAQAAIPAARSTHRYRAVLGGVAVRVPASAVGELAALPGVQAVYPDELHHPAGFDPTQRSIGAPRLWKELGGQGSAGEGVVVGVIDTGVWPEHPSFADPDPLGKPYGAPPAGWAGTCETPADPNAPPVACSNKLIGARTFLDTYLAFFPLAPGEFNSPVDTIGHGTWNTAIAAGNAGVVASVGSITDTISGIAPRAHVAVYKVCGGQGCAGSDIISATNQAVLDGVDIVNFSFAGGVNPYGDAVALAFLDAYEAGVFVAAAAGNGGPGPDTVQNRAPWMTTVGATTGKEQFLATGVLSSDDPRGRLRIAGSSVSGASGPTPVVSAADLGDPRCLGPVTGSTNAFVVCEGGTNSSYKKSDNVRAGGGVGMILYNLTFTDTLNAKNDFVPTLHVDQETGQEVLSFLATHTDVTAILKAAGIGRDKADRVAPFSGRGGPGQTLGVSKPDLVAPGVNILTANTPAPHFSFFAGASGLLFQVVEGTSMAAPHVAGAAALLRQLHPDWTPGETQSALMLTARRRKVVQEDGETPAEPFDVGAGRLDLAAAAKARVTLDATKQDFLDLQGALWNVNRASVYVPAPSLTTTVVITRTFENASDRNTTLRWKTGGDLGVDVEPDKARIAAGTTAVITFTIDASGLAPGEVGDAFARAGRFVYLPIVLKQGP